MKAQQTAIHGLDKPWLRMVLCKRRQGLQKHLPKRGQIVLLQGSLEAIGVQDQARSMASWTATETMEDRWVEKES